MSQRQVLVLDFGSQYTQLIARRLRELEIYAEILPYTTSAREIRSRNPSGLILSGGPDSVHRAGSPRPDPEIFRLELPILGICYGMQLLVALHGGKVAAAKKREYGYADVELIGRSPLFDGVGSGDKLRAWMSHGDGAQNLGNGFKVIAKTSTAPYAAISDDAKRLYGVQFHPEVAHTPEGSRVLENFARRICGHDERWTMSSLLDRSIADIKAAVGDGSVICGLSGGVDSSVAAALIHRAIGKKLRCIFVDTGLLREGDRARMKRLSQDLGLSMKVADASGEFLKRLKGVTDPERKRKIIGKTFIEVFEKEAKKTKADFLAQGTLYPDVIESVSVHGPSAVIKSHHNVGGLPKRMKLKLVEPLRFLFKDEVRRLGREMKIPGEILQVHPFPGPGLAIRILGSITPERTACLRQADAIVQEEMRASGWYDKVWQAFAVLLPVKSVGVMGDERTYENTAVLRVVESLDGMTADWTRLPYDVLRQISSRIISEVKGVNRVVYDISSKPPATIEWE